VSIPRELLSDDIETVLYDPKIHIVAELVGGVGWTREAVLRLLAAGKDVVTANKALLALHGQEIFAAARKHGRAIAFEASVAGGVPIIAALTECLTANRITSIQGILNGTSNFILSSMTDGGQSYSAALAEAQNRGYAEADPTLDVDGSDAAHKLAILAHIAFGLITPVSTLEKRGIANLDSIDIHFAGELGYAIKLLAETWIRDDRVAIHVSPVLLRKQNPLALVRGAYNAIRVIGDAVGETIFYGQGAGMMPTASAVMADIIDLAISREGKRHLTSRLWTEQAGPRMSSSREVRSRFYLRLVVADKPGVLSEVAGILAKHDISIASVIQHEAPEVPIGQRVHLVIMTHTATTGKFRDACEQLDRLESVVGSGVHFPVED
jgi:homoserine dehydrogenase